MTSLAVDQVKRSVLVNLLSDAYQSEAFLDELHRTFVEMDYVRLPDLLSNTAFGYLSSEVRALEAHARAKSFVMPGYETPRIMKTLGGTAILSKSPTLWSLYNHYDLRMLVESIVGAKVHPCQHRNEFTVINYLEGCGATHGWHLDDPAYALILFFVAPESGEGGGLEFVRDWRQVCEQFDARPEEEVEGIVEVVRSRGLVQVENHSAGDAYLLRSDRCLHRVTEVCSHRARRVVLNMAYEATPDPSYGDTASLLYDDE